MTARIEQDHARFRDIIRGRIKRELRGFISKGELVGRQGNNLISIPIPSVELPNFRFGENPKGVGQGDGEAGKPADGEGASGQGQAGDAPGEHALEVEVTLDELAEILGEELELPNIEPRGNRELHSDTNKYTNIRTTGPESLRHRKRTYKKALRRQMSSGTYDPDRPVIIPIKEDVLYRSWKETSAPQSNAVIIYMMDVSGSMGDEQKEIVRIETFWIDTWLRSQYEHLERRFIVHDAAAKEVDEHTFYHLRESGGTKISSAYDLCVNIMAESYAPQDWNIYPFHFSDGDNWGGGDTDYCLKVLQETILPAVNQFSYGQVESPYGSGQFIKDLEEQIREQEVLVLSRIENKNSIADSIRTFLQRGR